MKTIIIKFIILFVVNQVCSDEEFFVQINKKYSVSVGKNIKPEDFTEINNITELVFFRVVNQKVSSDLTISNFSELNILRIQNQSLEYVPRLKNIRTGLLSLGYNQIKSIKNNTFTDVSINGDLYLHSNQISDIDDNTFPLLSGIILNCNNLTTLRSSWFREPSKLRTIYLARNRIATLDKDMFVEFTSMTSLVLSSNQIKQIPDGIFHFTILYTLDLENNQLYEIKSTWFTAAKVHITQLKISFNRLSYIKQEFLDKVSIYYAFISGNPWQCPCLNLIKKWMLDAKIYHWVLDEYKDVLPVCIYANSFKDICIPHIETELYETYISGTDVPYKTDCL